MTDEQWSQLRDRVRDGRISDQAACLRLMFLCLELTSPWPSYQERLENGDCDE